MNLPSELPVKEAKSVVRQNLPPIPAKRYFTIGEVGDLCAVKPHVLRYWEQEFNQLKPQKRRGNRRYYQHHEVILIRRIRDLLYNEGFTIHGAKNRLQELEAQWQIRTELEAVLDILNIESEQKKFTN
jgi:DNA-binding transcriptional MerR regulator